ncbi:dipeptidase PepV [Calorimonas adulescens]|jgi:dipeptidase, putative|uniref:Dipeptidase PepV n=1 Tax=Calorimonas adulescens TaxID=2606906 RepID=A0A5D8Q925_9THEO|nr:dipeptidase PepV [Calorimonas adulescens]TZE81021.1 dipeptidase PepV [Calorimonas adulescens]
MDNAKELISKKIDELRDRLVEATQEIVRVKSVLGPAEPGKPFGEGPAKAIETALKISEELGFKTKNVDNYVGYAEYGEGKEMVGVLGHLDVVPEGDGWTYPPYGAEIHDDRIYGRGTIDDKGPTMAALFGLKAIKELGLPISKRVRILFGSNEESGSNEIEYYLEHDEAPTIGFTPDANFTVIYAEKGITLFDVVMRFDKKPTSGIKIVKITGGEVKNMVPRLARAVLHVDDESLKKSVIEAVEDYRKEKNVDLSCEDNGDGLTIVSTGVAAHGATPEQGKNAIMQLFMFLDTLDLGDTDVKKFIHFFAENVGMETNGKKFGVYLKDETGELTFNIGTVSVDENEGRLGLNIRYPVTYTYDDFIKPFNKKLEGTGIVIENMVAQNPLYFPKDHPLIQTLSKVYHEVTGNEPVLLAIGGGTYAKEMKNMVAFGPNFPGQPELDHQTDEYIAIDHLVQLAKIYGSAIYELAK